MQALFRYFQQLISIGIRADLPFQEKTRVKNINILAIIGCVAGTSYGFLGYDSLVFAVSSLVYAIGMAFILLSHWRGWYNFTIIYIVVFSCIVNSYFAIGFGNTLGAEYLFILAFIIVQHQLKGNRYIQLNTIIIIINFIIVVIIINLHPVVYLQVPKLARFFYYVNLLFTFFISAALIIRFRTIAEGYQREIEEKNLRLERQKEELSHSNKTKDTLFSIIGHDIKGPILGVKTLLTMMRAMPASDLDTYFDKVDKSLETTHTTLENLLDWALQQQNGVNRHEKIPLKILVQEVFQLFEQNAQQKNITLHETLSLDIYIYANPNQVSFILRNLVANSLKFTKVGGMIEVHSSVSENDFISIAVKDNGVGIDKVHIAKLFALGKRFSTYGTANEKGNGLGLNLCLDFVKQNGGEIYVESEKGVGSTFYVLFPKG